MLWNRTPVFALRKIFEGKEVSPGHTAAKPQVSGLNWTRSLDRDRRVAGYSTSSARARHQDEAVGSAVVVLALVGAAGAREHVDLGARRCTSRPGRAADGVRRALGPTPWAVPLAVKASHSGCQRSTLATSSSTSQVGGVVEMCRTTSVRPRPWSTTWSPVGAQPLRGEAGAVEHVPEVVAGVGVVVVAQVRALGAGQAAEDHPRLGADDVLDDVHCLHCGSGFKRNQRRE